MIYMCVYHTFYLMALADSQWSKLTFSIVCYIDNIANDNAYLLICGDFNARIATCPDFVVDDSNCHVHVDVLPDEYTIDSNVTQRVPQNTVRPDSNGLMLLELCRQTGMRILNGRNGNDANVGKYSYIAPNGSSVIDYMLASQSLFEFLQFFEVHDPNILTDQCCISLHLEFPMSNETHDTSYDLKM